MDEGHCNHLQLHELAKPAGIVVPACLRVAKCLEQGICLENLPNRAVLLHFCVLDGIVFTISPFEFFGQLVALLLALVSLVHARLTLPPNAQVAKRTWSLEMTAKWFIRIFTVSVFPAPDSPDTRIL